jgi:hypothetical protein
MKTISRILPVLAIFVFLSCKTQTTAPSGTATILGRVWTAFGYEDYTPPFSGIKVALDGTNISTITNDSGNYELDNVPSGTYSVSFTKLGYGEIRWFGQSVQGGGNSPIYWDQIADPSQITVYHSPTLYQQPDFVTTLHSLTLVNGIENYTGTYVQAIGTYSGSYPIAAANFAIYYSNSSNVSSLPGDYSIYYCSNSPSPYWQIDTVAKTFTISMPLIDVEQDGGFKSGDSIYVATYGAPYYGISPPNDYFDPQTGNYVLTSINQTPSPVFGIKIP